MISKLMRGTDCVLIEAIVLPITEYCMRNVVRR